MEQHSANERISLALTTLRNEMADLRNQDIKLMKQLLHINDTITTISETSRSLRRRKSNSEHNRRCVSSYTLPISPVAEEDYKSARQTRVPGISWSMYYSEGSLCSASDFSGSDEDFDNRSQSTLSCASPNMSPNLSRNSSTLSISDCESSISDEDLFKTNIKLWKLSRTNISV